MRRGRKSHPMGRDSVTLALPDRPDCVRQHECRSPYACGTIRRCADSLTPAQDMLLFGYGANGGAAGRCRREVTT